MNEDNDTRRQAACRWSATASGHWGTVALAQTAVAARREAAPAALSYGNTLGHSTAGTAAGGQAAVRRRSGGGQRIMDSGHRQAGRRASEARRGLTPDTGSTNTLTLSFVSSRFDDG